MDQHQHRPTTAGPSIYTDGERCAAVSSVARGCAKHAALGYRRRSDSSIDVPAAARHAEAWSRRSSKYYLVAHGRIRFVLDGQAHDLERGDFCMVRQGRRFSYSNEQSEDAVLVLIHTPALCMEDDVFVTSSRD